jgi:glycosyltransferase involved in cell wall biosynthesis
MRIAIVYDCLYPNTVGGAERWYRRLAENLSESCEVTYLTRRQWAADEGPGTPFETLALAPGGPLYTGSGRRRIWPPIRFGIGVFWHFLRHGRRYDVVHSDAFPYFSLIGVWLALRVRRLRTLLLVDWFELWSREYWVEYLGAVGGRLGYAVQRLCIRLPDRSFAFSDLHSRRLLEEGHRAPVVRLTGLHDVDASRSDASGSEQRQALVVFAGRHIPEKRVTIVPDVIALACKSVPTLRGLILGDGPERERVLARIRELGLEEAIDTPGRVSSSEVTEAIGRSACLILPSRREGYGLVVVEACAQGTPAVVAEGADNAATELVENGVNGVIAKSAEPGDLAAAVVRVIHQGEALRRSTLEWYRAHTDDLSIQGSLAKIREVYAHLG